MPRAAAAAARPRPLPVLPALLAIAFVAGTLDISYNLVYNAFRAITPAMVFRFIAAGLVGVPALRPLGDAAVALGVAIHFSIAFAWTLLFYLLSRRLAFLLRRPAVWGLAYGAVVYLAMTYLVLPLTRIPARPGHLTLFVRLNDLVPLLVCIGLTIALLTRRWLPRR